jgi:uncharacterized SAM-binding protein YcdF (DUF218 family)
VGATVVAVLLGLGAGFVLFARTVASYLPGNVAPRADGIVVLTGGELRLLAGARLLKEGRGARLLISGVNLHTSRQDLRRLSGLSERLFAARVDIDYANTTIDNAEETKAWAEAKGYRKLIVVTSSYHMPRSLTELSRAMPEVFLVPYPVVPSRFKARQWWTDGFTARVLLAEYAKFLPSAARYGASRVRRWAGAAIAARSHAGW